MIQRQALALSILKRPKCRKGRDECSMEAIGRDQGASDELVARGKGESLDAVFPVEAGADESHADPDLITSEMTQSGYRCFGSSLARQ
jgi:hypothetical protein